MTTRAVVDVTHLPEGALDHRSPIWWGNLLLLLIETTMFVLLAAAYLYIRNNYAEWPPPLPDGPDPLRDTAPDLLIPTINLVLILAGVIPMYYADRAALRMDERGAKLGTLIALILSIVVVVLRGSEFSALHFKWNDNAYASAAWALLFLHLLHQLVILAEDSFMLIWTSLKGLDHSHARDVRVTAIYWYWIAGIWVPLYILIYWGPRFL